MVRHLDTSQSDPSIFLVPPATMHGYYNVIDSIPYAVLYTLVTVYNCHFVLLTPSPFLIHPQPNTLLFNVEETEAQMTCLDSQVIAGRR